MTVSRKAMLEAIDAVLDDDQFMSGWNYGKEIKAIRRLIAAAPECPIGAIGTEPLCEGKEEMKLTKKLADRLTISDMANQAPEVGEEFVRAWMGTILNNPQPDMDYALFVNMLKEAGVKVREK